MSKSKKQSSKQRLQIQRMKMRNLRNSQFTELHRKLKPQRKQSPQQKLKLKRTQMRNLRNSRFTELRIEPKSQETQSPKLRLKNPSAKMTNRQKLQSICEIRNPGIYESEGRESDKANIQDQEQSEQINLSRSETQPYRMKLRNREILKPRLLETRSENANKPKRKCLSVPCSDQNCRPEKKTKLSNTASYTDNFRKAIKLGPTTICQSCDGLFFKTSTKLLKRNAFSLKFSENFLKQVSQSCNLLFKVKTQTYS